MLDTMADEVREESQVVKAYLSPDRKLERAIDYLEDNRWYLAAEVCRLGHPEMVNARVCKTAAVAPRGKDDDDIRFIFNEDFLEELDVSECAFVMGHEAMHVVLGHCLTMQTMQNRYEQWLFNLAADAVVNDLLHLRFGLPLPENVPVITGEKLLGFRCDRLGALEVLKLLNNRNKQWSNQRSLQELARKFFGAQGSDSNSEDDASNPHRFWSKIDREAMDELADRVERRMRVKEKELQEQADALQERLANLPSIKDEKECEECEGEGCDACEGTGKQKGKSSDCEGDGDLGISAPEVEAMRDALAEELEQMLESLDAAKTQSYGSSTIGGIRDPKPADPLKGPWREQVKRRFRDLVKYIDTWRRPPRSLISSYPECVLPDNELEAKPHVVVAIDTSGSMGTDDIARCKATIDDVPKEAIVTVLAFDADCYPTEVRGLKQRAKKLSQQATLRGGGGTSFQVVIDWINEQKEFKNKWPDVVVFFTDGWAPAPDVSNKQGRDMEDRVVFVLTPQGDDSYLSSTGAPRWGYSSSDRKRPGAPKWEIVKTQ